MVNFIYHVTFILKSAKWCKDLREIVIFIRIIMNGMCRNIDYREINNLSTKGGGVQSTRFEISAPNYTYSQGWRRWLGVAKHEINAT